MFSCLSTHTNALVFSSLAHRGRAVPQNSGFDGRDGWVSTKQREFFLCRPFIGNIPQSCWTALKDFISLGPRFLFRALLLLYQVPNRNRLDNQFYNILLNGNQVDSDFQLELQDNTGNGNFPNQFLWRRGPDRDGQVSSAWVAGLFIPLSSSLDDEDCCVLISHTLGLQIASLC